MSSPCAIFGAEAPSTPPRKEQPPEKGTVALGTPPDTPPPRAYAAHILMRPTTAQLPTSFATTGVLNNKLATDSAAESGDVCARKDFYNRKPALATPPESPTSAEGTDTLEPSPELTSCPSSPNYAVVSPDVKTLPVTIKDGRGENRVVSSAAGLDTFSVQPGDLKRQEPTQLPPLPPIPFRLGKPLDIRATVKAIAARTKILEKVVSSLETEMAGFRNDVDNLDKTVGDPLAKLGTEMRGLTSSAETMGIEIQSLKEEFALRRAESAVIHDELAILTRDTHRLKQDNETFFIQINQLKTSTALLKTESALEGARMDKLLADSATIQIENEALCTNFEKLQAEGDTFKTDIKKLKKVYADIRPFAGDHYAMVHSHPGQQKEGSKGPQFTLKRKRGRADREERVLKGSTPKRQKPAPVA